MSNTRQIRAAFPLDAIHPDIACGYGGIHERCDLHRLCDEHDALLAALTDAASSLKWIAEESRDETASNIRAYAHSREGVTRAAIAKAGGGNG